VRPLGTAAVEATWLLLSFHYSATGEERREGRIDLALDPSGSLVAETLPARCGLEAPGVAAADADPCAISPTLLETASAMARVATLEALAPARELLARRLGRDVSRLHGYYRAMQEEVLRAGARRSPDAAAQDKLLARVNGIPAELERRIAEARTRLGLRVVVRPVAAVLVTMPARSVRLRILRRKASREIELRYGALQRSCDVPVCEGCRAVTVHEPWLCDERVHLLCEDCMWTCPGCGARTCLACAPRCRRCGREPGAPAEVVEPTKASPSPAPKAPPAQGPPRRPTPVGGATADRPTPPRPRRAPPAAADARARGRRAVKELAAALPGGVEPREAGDRVRAALASLGRARSGAVASEAGLPVEDARRAIKALRARGEVVHFGHGRGTEYELVEGAEG